MIDSDILSRINKDIDEYHKEIVGSLVGEGPGAPDDYEAYCKLRGMYEAIVQVKQIITGILVDDSVDAD